MRHLVFCLFLGVAGWTTLPDNANAAADLSADLQSLSCAVTYAGHTQHIVVRPTTEPYREASIGIKQRFRFKALQVQGEGVTPRIGIYVYFETPQHPQLIQHVLIQPPYPKAPKGSRVDLLGEQRLYAGPLERELIYRCFLDHDTP